MSRHARNPDLSTRLARSIKRERSRLAWTQERAAAGAEISLRQYQRLEEGAVNVTLQTLEKLCTAFKVDVVRLFSP